MLIALILAAILDLALAALLVAVSGFIFGGGPEGLDGELSAAAMWWTGFIACLAAPVAGVVLRARELGGWGVLVAFVPPAVGACFLAL
jgi:hypothetical protein